jgi:hypothetical protein
VSAPQAADEVEDEEECRTNSGTGDAEHLSERAADIGARTAERQGEHELLGPQMSASTPLK